MKKIIFLILFIVLSCCGITVAMIVEKKNKVIRVITDDGKNSSGQNEVTIRISDNNVTIGDCSENGWEEQAGRMIKRSIPVGVFKKIQSRFNYKIIFTQGQSTGKVELTINEDAEDCAEIYTSGDILYLGLKNKHNRVRTMTAIVRVQAPCLEEIKCELSSSFKSEGLLLQQRPLYIEVSTSGSVYMDKIKAPDLTLHATTSGAIKCMKTDCGVIVANASTSSSIKLYGVYTESITASATTSSIITLEGKAGVANCESNSTTGGRINSSGLILDMSLLKESSEEEEQNVRPTFRQP